MDIKLSGMYTQIFMNKRVIIENCDGIIDYNQEEVVIKTGKLSVVVVGKDLKIKALTDKTADIEGFISSISFSY